jgi:hypothetical protein
MGGLLLWHEKSIGGLTAILTAVGGPVVTFVVGRRKQGRDLAQKATPAPPRQ